MPRASCRCRARSFSTTTTSSRWSRRSTATTKGRKALFRDIPASTSSRRRRFSHLLAADTRLIDHTHLVELAELDGLESIYVFNEAGETIATSTTRYDFALPEDETDQSYGFWDVVKGYETSFVQDVYWSDGTGMTFFVGVPRYDEKGMVELGIPSTIPAERMQRTELTSLLASVPIGNDGFLMSVNAQDSTISYAENVRYIGQSAESHGVTASALSDGYLGYQTIDGTTCLVSTVLTHDQYVMVCVPSSSIGVGDLSNAVITAILSFVLLLPCIGQLVIQRMPARGSDREERSTGVLQPQPKGPIDIKTTSGETKRVVPITGRWSGGMAAWSDKTPEAKLMAIVRALLLVVTAVVLVYVYAFQTSNSASALSFIISMRWEKVPNIFSFTYIGVFVLTAAMVVWVLRTVIAMTFRNLNARIETVGRLFSNFIKYGVWIGVLVLLAVSDWRRLAVAVGFGGYRHAHRRSRCPVAHQRRHRRYIPGVRGRVPRG